MGVTRTPITRVFLPAVPEVGGWFALPGGEARHVFKVLRARAGDVVEVADATGRLVLAELTGPGGATVIDELEAPGEEVGVMLYQAVPKGGRMDLVVEKATEVGATGIVPLLTKRGVVNPRDGKVGRWRRVAEAAARQSLGLRVPWVSEPVRFEDAVQEAAGAGVVLHNGPGLQPVEDAVAPGACLFIGPEGGWSEGELALGGDQGLSFAQLGSRRLRSETAGIVAVARARAALDARVGVSDER